MTNSKTKYAGKLIFAIMIFLNLIFINENVLSQDSQNSLISKWYWTQPVPTGNMLRSVFFINDNTGFAAGESGTIMKTTDGGSVWNVST